MENENRILKKMESLEESVNEIRVQLATKGTQQKNDRANMDRFWTVTWPSILGKVDDNSTEIAKIQLRMVRLETKLIVYGSIIFAAANIISMFLIEFLKSALIKIP